jgi:transposase-like protein
MFEPKLTVVADMLRGGREEITAFADFPEAHWRKVWSINTSPIPLPYIGFRPVS